MSIVIGFLTVILFVDCVFLVFLVLLQLPKKEAGAGMAFGGAATDALFGAGSGNALTMLTQWTSGIFFALALLIAILTSHHGKSSVESLTEELTKGSASGGKISSQAAGAPATTSGSNASGGVILTSTNAPAPTSGGTQTAPAPAPLPSLQFGTTN